MRGPLAIAGALAALLLAACNDAGTYRVIISYPDQAALDRAARVELVVDASVGCAELLARTDQPDTSFAAHGDIPALGRVPFGLNAFLARARDGDCQAFAQGCTEADIQPGVDATVRVALSYVADSPCRSDEQCSAGSCVRVDASGDAATNDGATVDSAIGDRVIVDQRASDQTAADHTAHDGAASDTVLADQSACDGGCLADGGPNLDAANVDGTIADGQQPDTFVACSAGARRCIDGRTLAICENPPVETHYDCTTACDSVAAWCWTYAPSNLPALTLPPPAGGSVLVISSDTVIDTDAYTIGGLSVPHAVTTQGATAPAIAVLKFDSFSIEPGVTVRVVGQRALAIAASLDVDIAGTLDLSATGTIWHEANLPGPGGFAGGTEGQSGSGPCPGLVGFGDSQSHIHSSGSGGGGFGAAGGRGGNEELAGYGGGAGGTSCGLPELMPLRGGSGGAGQVLIPERDPPTSTGLGGGGGGAIQIAAGRTLTIAGTGKIIAAGGGGGEGSSGGGGAAAQVVRFSSKR